MQGVGRGGGGLVLLREWQKRGFLGSGPGRRGRAAGPLKGGVCSRAVDTQGGEGCGQKWSVDS